MPKDATYPTLYDNCLQISITNLKQRGYLMPEQIKAGEMKWSSNGKQTACISFLINTAHRNHYIELNYTANGNPLKYKVQLMAMPSNLGKGVIWYFVCPSTGKICRKLYLVEKYFCHRSAFRGCMYYVQTLSKSSVSFNKLLEADYVLAELQSRYFKKYYGGKPTKRYLKLLKQIKKTNQIPVPPFFSKLSLIL